MSHKLISLLVVTLTLVLACGGETPLPTATSGPTPAPGDPFPHPQYPNHIRDNWIIGCVSSGASEAYCRCGIAWLENTVPIDSFLTHGPMSKERQAWLLELGDACRNPRAT